MDQKPVVLIVDDEPIGRQLLEAILFAEGYQLLFAEDGEVALQKVIENKPTVILCDVMMPKMDGFEVCRRIRKDENIAHTPIFLITALDDRDSRIKGIDAGADDYISKPLDRVEILAKVRNRVVLNKLRQKETTSEKPISIPSKDFDLNPLLSILIDKLLVLEDVNTKSIDKFRTQEIFKSKYAFSDFPFQQGKVYAMISNKLEGTDSTLANCILKMIIQHELNKNICSPSEIIQASLEKFLHLASHNEATKLLGTSYSLIVLFQDYISKDILVSGINQTLFVSQYNKDNKPDNNDLLIPYYLMVNQDIRLSSAKEIVLFSENMHELYPQPVLVSFLNSNLENNILKPLAEIIPRKFEQNIDILAVKLSF